MADGVRNRDNSLSADAQLKILRQGAKREEKQSDSPPLTRLQPQSFPSHWHALRSEPEAWGSRCQWLLDQGREQSSCAERPERKNGALDVNERKHRCWMHEIWMGLAKVWGGSALPQSFISKLAVAVAHEKKSYLSLPLPFMEKTIPDFRNLRNLSWHQEDWYF